jgi:predicted nuclease of predicted toxin-antitoxin system
MRVLVDECVDWRIARDLARHDARTVKQLGWQELKDGSLLTRAAAEFDVFLTVDTKLPYQQNIAVLDIAVIVLRGRTTRLADLRELLDRLQEALTTARQGEVTVIGWLDRP